MRGNGVDGLERAVGAVVAEIDPRPGPDVADLAVGGDGDLPAFLRALEVAHDALSRAQGLDALGLGIDELHSNGVGLGVLALPLGEAQGMAVQREGQAAAGGQGVIGDAVIDLAAVLDEGQRQLAEAVLDAGAVGG